jgi:GNAT superfamily N-acetyltransferase
MYPAYLKEREGFDTVSTDTGFATYKITGDECYLRDIYVTPEHRKDGVASALADAVCEIAKNRGCHWLVGSVSPAANNSHASLLVLIAYGMRLKKAEQDMVYFYKRIA